ncbi:MAG: hypothetical protein ACRDY4_00705 [Acidimicrobiia bacterium]
MTQSQRRSGRPKHRPKKQRGPYTPPRRVLRPRDWHKRVGWPLLVLGTGLFLVGLAAPVTGWNPFPFDTHHVLTRVGGAVVALWVLAWVAR